MLFIISGMLLPACGSGRVGGNPSGGALTVGRFDEPIFSNAAERPGAADSIHVDHFERNTATAALNRACDEARNCYNGPPVIVLVTTTFAHDGNPLVARVDEPVMVVGTMIAGCVEDRFRSVHLPPFSGEPVTAGKKCRVGRDTPWDCGYDECTQFPASQDREFFIPR